MSKVLFHSTLQISIEQILQHGQTTTVEDAISEVKFHDKRHEILHTYNLGRNVLSESMKLKLAENGISFEVLQNIYTRFGNEWTVCYSCFAIIRVNEQILSLTNTTSLNPGKNLEYFEDHP